MKATIENLSPLPRTHWVTATVPKALGAGLKKESTFVADNDCCRKFRAVRGRKFGNSMVYRVRATLGGHERVVGELRPVVHPDARQFTAHRWVSDDLNELVPKLGVRTENRDLWSQSLAHPTLIDTSSAHQRWTMTAWIPAEGIIFQWWADLLSDDPVINIWGKIVWSNRKDPAHMRRFEAVAISSGELIRFDFAKRHGMGAPVPIGSEWFHGLAPGGITLDDGAALPLSGVMLATHSPKPDDPKPDPEDSTNQDIADRGNLIAAFHGGIVGVCHDWDGHWLACKKTPKVRGVEGERSVAAFRWRQHVDAMKVTAGWFEERPLVHPEPGTTGDKDDFGASKGTHAVTLSDPRWIELAKHSVQADLFRGVHHYDEHGSPIRLSDHPNWVTWDGKTHWHTGVSTDRLDKVGPAPYTPATGHRGYDDQHRSQNNIAAFMALTDDPLMEDHIRHHITTDAASYRAVYPDFGIGATRAVGRTLGTLAQLSEVVDTVDAARLRVVIDKRLAPVLTDPYLKVAGPMKVLTWSGPDARKKIYDADGNLANWTSLWEHGLAAVGLMQLYKGRGLGLEVLEVICETLARFGCFQDDGDQWHIVDDILWSGGAAPPGGLTSDSPHIVSRPGTQGTGNWTFAGIMVAQQILADDHPVRAKVDACVQAITKGKLPLDRMTAEWRAF
jgi:hypothetical protein